MDENVSAKGTAAAKTGSNESLRSLYPFLYEQTDQEDSRHGDKEQWRAEVLGEVARSTADKAAEIVAVRRDVVARNADRLAECGAAMASLFSVGGRLFAFGNGGSSTDAQDIATTFMNPPRGRPLPALALANDVAVTTALANDVNFEVAFARQLEAFGRQGDIAVGLSTSGGSTNVVHALETAERRGMLTVGLAGYEGGQMAELDVIDHVFVVPSASVHRIQEAQATLYHVLWELTQHALCHVDSGPRAMTVAGRAGTLPVHDA